MSGTSFYPKKPPESLTPDLYNREEVPLMNSDGENRDDAAKEKARRRSWLPTMISTTSLILNAIRLLIEWFA